jgi:hypothetical protein
MKLIFSRKGFDNSSGGVPSPIFPDGSIYSLPIPDKNSPIKYKDIFCEKYDVGQLVSDLTKGNVKPDYGAHLDPDLCNQSLVREKNWKPIFGQVGAAQGHLMKQDVKPGDLFLFFGLFREVSQLKKRWVFKPRTLTRHIIFGWMQIAEIHPVNSLSEGGFGWAKYHPHFHGNYSKNNTIYIANEYLDLPGIEHRRSPGSFVFKQFSPQLQLTKEGSYKVSTWELPGWFFPDENAKPLSFHGDLDRWQKKNGKTILQTVGRGQEFVLDCGIYNESLQWISTFCKLIC